MKVEHRAPERDGHHTVDDIVNSLDGIWGLVGATRGTEGNLLRLEEEPRTETPCDTRLPNTMATTKQHVLHKQTFQATEKIDAI